MPKLTNTKPLLFLTLLISGLILTSPPVLAAGAGLKVIATIRPLHSLVAGIMQGVGVPKLLIVSGSPHNFYIKPSDAIALDLADLVFWIGPQMEVSLKTPLQALAAKADIVALGAAEGLKLLQIRGDVRRHHSSTDMHMWLDPDNAKLFVRAVVKVLSRKDPANRAVYQANGAYQINRLTRLADEIERMLMGAGDKKPIFYHDAFQYFEHRFNLKSAGFVSAGPFRAAGARHVRHLRRLIVSGAISCVLTEPQFAPALVLVLVENTDVQIGILDPIGAGWPPGPDLYFNMMRKNAEALSKCLGNKPAGPVE